MTAIPSQPPPGRRKRSGWQALFVGALLLMAGFLWMRGRPERLMNAPFGNFTISDGKLYSLVSPIPPETGVATVQVQSVQENRRRVISTEEAHVQFYNFYAPNAFSIANGQLYYAVRSGSSPELMRVGALASGQEQFLGTYLLRSASASGRGAAGQEIAHFSPPLPKTDVRIRTVALQGGTPRDVVTVRPAATCLVGDHLFWIQPGVEETVQRAQGRSGRNRIYWREVTAHSDLMLTSLVDGTTRCIRHGVPRVTSLVAGPTGAVWKEPMPYPAQPTLFYACASDGSVRSLGTMAEGQGLQACAELGDRLYWPVTLSEPGRNGASHSVLMSAGRNGADIREVAERVGKQPIENLEISVVQGTLYGCLSEPSLDPANRSKNRRFLFRLRPDQSDPIEILRKLPEISGDYHFDGGYLYFVVSEPKRSVWATVTDNDAFEGYTNLLYRVPLGH